MDPTDESRRILERVKRDSESVLDSSMRRAADHFSGRDAMGNGNEDAAERWGRLAGRWLAALCALACLVYLLRTL